MLDLELVFCEKQSLASAITSKVINLFQEKPNTGTYPMYLLLRFPKHGTGTGASNAVTFKIQDSADGTSDWKDVALMPAIPGAELNKVIVVPMPMKHRQFVRVATTVAGTVTGEVTAYMSDEYPIEVDYKIEGFEWTEPTP